MLRSQLEYLVELLPKTPSVTVRVLPVDARIDGYVVPRSAFSLYSYPDAADPQVVAVDTVTIVPPYRVERRVLRVVDHRVARHEAVLRLFPRLP